MRNNLYICNANPQTKTTLISHICGSNFGTHYIRYCFYRLIVLIDAMVLHGKNYLLTFTQLHPHSPLFLFLE